MRWWLWWFVVVVAACGVVWDGGRWFVVSVVVCAGLVWCVSALGCVLVCCGVCVVA